MADIWLAGKDVEDLANELIANTFPDLSTASLAFVFKEKASSSELEANLICTAKKVSGFYHILTGEKDFVIVITYSLWDELNNLQKEAMLSSALASCTIKRDENDEPKNDPAGNPCWVIKPYDIIGHGSVINKYGIEMFANIAECAKVIVNKVEQVTQLSEIEKELASLDEGVQLL